MDSSFGTQLLSTALALAFVLALAGGSLFLLKRLQARAGNATGRDSGAELKFLRALPVGTKERVVAIQYAGEEWLLGVTAGGISLLGRRQLIEATAKTTEEQQPA